MSSDIETDPRADSPSAEFLRRQLRIVLTKARLTAGVSQKAAASQLDWSMSKLARIEAGAVPVTPTDVRAMLGLYGVKEPTEVDRLLQLARDAREAKDFSEYNAILEGDFKEMVAQEPHASSIWKFEPTLVSGYFQTPEYSRAVLTALGHEDDDAALRTELRLKRQGILESAAVPQINVVMGELVLRRLVGNRNVMRGQLTRLLELNERDELSLRVLPFEAGPHPGMGEPFTVLQFDNLDLHDSLYLEDARKRTSALDEPDLVSHYLTLYGHLLELADTHGSFVDHVERALRDLDDVPG